MSGIFSLGLSFVSCTVMHCYYCRFGCFDKLLEFCKFVSDSVYVDLNYFEVFESG